MKKRVLFLVMAAVAIGMAIPPAWAFSPADIPGLQLWLDAGAQDTVTAAGGKVSQWKDLGSNKFHAAQGTVEYRPTLVENAYGSKSMVRFEAAGPFDPYGVGTRGEFLRTDCIPATGGMYDDGPRTIIIAVANIRSSGWHVNHILQYGSPMLRQAYGISSRGGHVSRWGVTYWQAGFDSGINSESGGGSIVVASYYSGVDHITVNGGTTATNTIQLDTAAGTYGKWGMVIGARIDPVWGKTTEGCCADIGEVLAFSAALSVADRQKIEGYLAHKWGMSKELPADHPYKQQPPGWSAKASVEANPKAAAVAPKAPVANKEE